MSDDQEAFSDADELEVPEGVSLAEVLRAQLRPPEV